MKTKSNQCNRTVMVVEDDFGIRETMQEVLESEGYNVITACNGKNALDLLNTTVDYPSLVLLDIFMPVMDGYDFLKVVSKDSQLASIPVYIHSANYNLQDLRGAKGILKKPASYDAIIELVQSYCDDRPNDHLQ